MPDVLIVGAGPSGAIAAILLARAGVRVTLVDRATFPRPKLCGDSLNPGALAALRRLRLASLAESRGVRIDGMLVTGEGGLAVEGRFPDGLHGRSIGRHEFDAALVADAVAAGADLLEGVTVRAPILEHRGRTATIVGVRAGAKEAPRDLRAPMTIAADGRHSTLAFALGLARHPSRPRRWAIGAYARDVDGLSAMGEMHIRPSHYIGVAPLPDGVANVCLVKPSGSVDRVLRDPAAALRTELALDPVLRDRFAAARFVAAPAVLGPLAVEAVPGAAVPRGLLLAGDACGFVDPMTGDGLRFAIRSGELAAAAALCALERGWEAAHDALVIDRRREFLSKWRFNRALRELVGSPTAVRAATMGARLAPALVRALIVRAGDCHLAQAPRDY